MKTTYSLFIFCLIFQLSLHAQNVSITVTDDGEPMSYHEITITDGNYTLGSGTTDNNGFVSIYAPDLRSKSIDVEGKYNDGTTKRDWSIKGTIKLDDNNSVHIRLEEVDESLSQATAEMDKQMKELEDKMDELEDKMDQQMNEQEDRMDKQMKALEDRMDQQMKELEDGADERSDMFSDHFSNKRNESPKAHGNKESIDFNTQLAKIKKTFSYVKKRNLSMELAESQALTTDQIQQILAELNSSFFKKRVAITAYPKCSDQYNYPEIIETFDSPKMKNDIRKATIGA